ncbi:MAG: di-trans,poly-cis-decaprenylcistransferase [Ruminococcaceae bacterium]|nr:di-trans,poly-cis-decaprenylcistransferase [Oscillospiraceae bacterium]
MLFFKKKASKKELPSVEKLRPDGSFKHIAFIMDGNGRWATEQGMPREYGHSAGAKTMKKVCTYCCDIGFKACTVYAFSTENWKRPEKEVNAIIKILENYMDEIIRDYKSYHNHFKFIGDLSVLPPELLEKVRKVESLNLEYDQVFNIAFNYGGRSELANAFNRLASKGITHASEDDISAEIYTAHCGDPDMIVRTGGDMRISNFLLWQAAYAELYFTDKFWPDLTEDDVDEIIRVFYSRKRRYGGI